MTDMTGVDSAFVKNGRGDVAIIFSDPAYIRTDTIIVDGDAMALHAVMHEGLHFLGYISVDMVKAFSHNRHVLLVAVRQDGTIFEYNAPLSITGRA